MIVLDMTQKISVRITTSAFNLENDILKLEIDCGIYDLTGKTITAAFSPVGVETAPLTVNTEGLIELPIYAGEIQCGVNYIQLNFRWSTNKLEQSPVMMWVIDKSLETTAPAQEEVNVITYLISEANRIVDEAGDLKIALDGSTSNASTAKDALDESISTAGTTKAALDGSIGTAETSKTVLDGSISTAGTKKTELDGSILNAGTAQNDLQVVINNSKINELIKVSTIQPAWGLWLEEVQ